MLLINITIPEVASHFEEYLRSEDLGFTRHGGEFEIPAADAVGWTLGRRYEYLLNKHKENGLQKQVQENEVVREDISGLKP